MTNKKPKKIKNILYIKWDDKNDIKKYVKDPNKTTYESIQDTKDMIEEIIVKLKNGYYF